jgi:hypothetical protein
MPGLIDKLALFLVTLACPIKKETLPTAALSPTLEPLSAKALSLGNAASVWALASITKLDQNKALKHNLAKSCDELGHWVG